MPPISAKFLSRLLTSSSFLLIPLNSPHILLTLLVFSHILPILLTSSQFPQILLIPPISSQFLHSLPLPRHSSHFLPIPPNSEAEGPTLSAFPLHDWWDPNIITDSRPKHCFISHDRRTTILLVRDFIKRGVLQSLQLTSSAGAM